MKRKGESARPGRVATVVQECVGLDSALRLPWLPRDTTFKKGDRVVIVHADELAELDAAAEVGRPIAGLWKGVKVGKPKRRAKGRKR